MSPSQRLWVPETALLRWGIGSSPGQGVEMSRHPNQSPPVDRSAFTGYWFPPEVIMLAVRLYLRYGLSYRDVGDSESPVIVVVMDADLFFASFVQMASGLQIEALVQTFPGEIHNSVSAGVFNRGLRIVLAETQGSSSPPLLDFSALDEARG